MSQVSFFGHLWLVLVLLFSSLACPRTSTVEREREPAHEQTQAVEQDDAPALPDGFSTSEQQIGEPTDGLTLRSIETRAHESFLRFVFELDGERPPATRARLLEDERVIEVSLHGVRMDETGNRPLVDETGEPFGSIVDVDVPPVTGFGRKLVLDDSLIAYEIRLSNPASFRLGSDEPSRITLDVATEN